MPRSTTLEQIRLHLKAARAEIDRAYELITADEPAPAPPVPPNGHDEAFDEWRAEFSEWRRKYGAGVDPNPYRYARATETHNAAGVECVTPMPGSAAAVAAAAKWGAGTYVVTNVEGVPISRIDGRDLDQLGVTREEAIAALQIAGFGVHETATPNPDVDTPTATTFTFVGDPEHGGPLPEPGAHISIKRTSVPEPTTPGTFGMGDVPAPIVEPPDLRDPDGWDQWKQQHGVATGDAQNIGPMGDR